MIRNNRNLAIALAALYQALILVKRTAAGLPTVATEEATCINSIFNIDPGSVETIYGDVEALRFGLKGLIEQLHGKTTERDVELTRYAVTVLHLERKLSQQTAYLDTLRKGIQKIDIASDSANKCTPVNLSLLARLYTDTVSNLSPRIIINGDPAILSTEEVKAKIRALLLAAIRAAVLWRQCGGTRIKLIFNKKAILYEAEQLLAPPPVIH